MAVREIAELNGLQRSMPVLAAVFTVVMLSSIGLPGLNGFVGEFLILVGTFVSARWWAVVGATGVILAAIYLLWAYQRVFHGRPDEANANLPDMTWREGAVMAPVLALIVLLGVFPQPVLDRINPSVERLLEHVERQADHRQPAVAAEGEHGAAEQRGEGGEAHAEGRTER
jgi:NADH-quinone oxidoreductase subunit M